MSLPSAVSEVVDRYATDLSSHAMADMFYDLAVLQIRSDRVPGVTDEARGMLVACYLLRRTRSDNKLQVPIVESEASNSTTRAYKIPDVERGGGFTRAILSSNDAGRDLLVLLESFPDEPIILR